MASTVESSDDVLVGFDVGGTNVRARVAVLRDGELEAPEGHPETLSRAAGSKAEVADFVAEVVRGLGGAPAAAAVAFAGPVTGDRVRMTNWPEPREIGVEELVDWGLPEGATAVANDVEAGACGLVRRLCRVGIDADCFEALRVPEDAPGAATGSMVLVVPGTGLGCAGIVRLAGRDGEDGFLPVASEGGHLAAAPLDDDHGRLVESLRHRLGPGSPSWEDFVSGEGLRTLYRHAAESGGGEPTLLEVDDPAAAIAEAAAAGEADAHRALTLYYRCVGRFAQALALAYRATGGVFLGGGSTEANREFIRDSPLVEEFLANREQRQLLERAPVHMVLEPLNLPGTLALAARCRRQATGSS